ncbi:YciI family protein [Streptomyces sp. WAC 00631]|uniref:YciI family protein n=1 Tax=unclassified Streptomyces TaxID=2593676 RepID=UPI001E30453A|nr:MULTISPECIES: YciI family protein [unclassified Streptomyces]MCC5033236.1 YciI family protein [Streptomyces sp. WAC 00631]MCC9741331.1 YciI family protein [Streptomyces sp. MNU89]
MVQIFGGRDTWNEEMAAYGEAGWRPLVTFMEEVNKDLTERGELVEAQGLGGPGRVSTVRARPDGVPEVTDGPHFRAEKILAGYWVIDVATPERAVEIAARISSAPRPDGAPGSDPVELHPIMAGPPE